MLARIYFLLTLCILTTTVTTSCKNAKPDDHVGIEAGYDLNHPKLIRMPTELDEISGLAFHSEDTSVFAIDDEVGWLYKIYLNHPKHIEKWKFSNGADFEDLVIIDSSFYALKSKGNIVGFRFLSSDSLFLEEYKFPTNGCEFETLYNDTVTGKLVLICKDCKSDSKSTVSTFSFDPQTLQYSNSNYTINAKRLAEILGEKSIKFKPSAAAIHPVTKELYILASVNKLLVIADMNGNIKTAFRLPAAYFKQPEGLCFTPAGDLLISNEAANTGNANILIYKYNPGYKK